MKLAFLYAGQGSQHVGMGRDLYEAYPAFRQVLDSAPVDFDLKSLCFDGPEEQLNDTRYTQPCMVAFAAGVTALLKEAGIVPEYAAGLSLGEYSALQCAGVFDAPTAISLVAFRGQAMANAVQGRPCGMAAVLGMDRESLKAVCQQASDAGVVYGDAVHAIAPSFILGKAKTVYSITQYGKESLDDMRSRKCLSDTDKIRMEILSEISSKKGKITRSVLQSMFSQKQLRLLSALERTGAIHTELLIDKIGKKFEETAVLKIDSEEAEELSIAFSRKAPLMSAVLRELAACSEIQLEDLKSRTGAGKNVINRLESRGFLKIEKNEIYRKVFTNDNNEKKNVPPLTPSQRNAYKNLEDIYSAGKARAVLLYGVTGSGKTRVIKELIDRVISDGKKVIVLVPEISLISYRINCHGINI